MSLRNGLGDSFRKGEVDGKKKERSGSRAYQKFFEGYEEIKVPKKNGKGNGVRRIYRGEYYRQEFSDARWYGMKVAYPLLAAGSCLLFGSAAYPYSGANCVWYVNLPQAVSMAVYLWLFAVVCFYIASPRNMTVSGWKRACRPMKKTMKVQAAAILATAVATMLYYLLNPSEYSGKVMVYLMEYLLGAGLIGVLYYLEHGTVYGNYRPNSGQHEAALRKLENEAVTDGTKI